MGAVTVEVGHCPFCGIAPSVNVRFDTYLGANRAVATIRCEHYGCWVKPHKVEFCSTTVTDRSGTHHNVYTQAEAEADAMNRAVTRWNKRPPTAGVGVPDGL